MRNLFLLICLALSLPSLFAQRRIETSSYNAAARNHYQQALNQRDAQDLPGAKRLLRLALQEDNRYVDAYDQMADLYYRQNLLDSAVYYYQQSVNIIPRHLLSHQRLALVFKQQNEFSAALVQYDVILRTFGDNPVIMAETYMSMAQVYEHGIKDDQGNPDWQGLMRSAEEAMRLYVMGGQTEKAARARSSAAKAYYHLGTYNIALRYLKESLKVEPSDPEMNYYLGATYLKMKKLDKANEYLSRSIELGYEIPRDVIQEWKNSY